MEKILLAGYMGSGKTTVGSLLSKLTGLEFMDLDDVIESQSGRTIRQLFASEGEIAFRKLEHKILGDLIAGDGKFILALGGGTPCYANNHLLLRAPGVSSFYLRAGVPQLCSRVATRKEDRPLISHIANEDLPAFIGMHLFERDAFYRNAHHIIDTNNKTPEEVAGLIVDQLRRA